MMTLVASALAGGDCIDDADALRTGGTACTLGGTVKALSTPAFARAGSGRLPAGPRPPADDADGPYRPAPGVAAPGSRRPRIQYEAGFGRRAQVAWSNPAVMGVFHPPVVAGGKLWCHRPGPAVLPPTAPASGGRRPPGRCAGSCPTSSLGF